MELTHRVSLTVSREAERFRQTLCTVLIDGISTEISVPGKILEAAIKISASRYLLFLTDDVIYEESLNIVLIDTNSGILDQLRLGEQDTTASFSELELTDNTAEFKFIGDTPWRVDIFPSPVLRLPFSDPRGVSRNLRFWKYIGMTINR